MKTEPVQVKYLKDYQVSPYKIDKVDLEFNLHDTKTTVKSTYNVVAQKPTKTLVLDGEELKLVSLLINGKKVDQKDIIVDKEKLTISNCPEVDFNLVIENEVNPEANTALDGLYKSNGMFCTQNEPEGFRRITYFLDRPDNLAVFTTKITADKKTNPILLSNGNLIEKGDLPDGKHFALWADPFPKPAYLYALVAGDLGVVSDKFTTMTGREIDLKIYVDKGNEPKCFHAMESLKKSMKWDEERFGLEYDLDIYMIVAVDSFNMGAMENKGLNIFNSAYVLASKETATDDNFYGIESVIGHEYFHNWTGNRITCRDWFQLTLKEGLTVYRDQEFSADLNSRAVCRIKDVKGLRLSQFSEDAGPTAHPIKPKSYIEMNNFYTSTIYEKGAEVIRMIETILGRDGFRKGMDKYFELFDGQAVTTEDFVHAMSVANGNYDFSQFKLWYDQAGTPKLDISYSQNLKDKKFTIKITQSCKNVGQETLVKKPYHMPFIIGLVTKSGADAKLTLINRNDQKDLSRGVVHLKNEVEEFVFGEISEEVVPSLNRDFSAPVKIVSNMTENELAFLMANDSNEFNRYEAFFKYSSTLLQEMIKTQVYKVNDDFLSAIGKIINDKNIDDDFKALCLTLPSINDLIQDQEIHDYDSSKKAIDEMSKFIALKFEDNFKELYASLSDESSDFKVDSKSMGRRKLKNTCLSYLCLTDDGEELCLEQFESANNMTDLSFAMACIVEEDFGCKSAVLNSFYDRFKDQTLVMQKWLSIQAASYSDSTFDEVGALLSNEVYSPKVPNLVRSLIGTFSGNKVQFFHKSGRGIKFIASQLIEVDKINPQVASRLASNFRDLKKLPKNLQDIARSELEMIVKNEGISKNVYEIVSKTLES